MQISKRPKPFALLLLFAAAALEAAAGLIWLFNIPGSEKNAFMFGYSIYRLGLGGVLGFLAILFSGLTLVTTLRPTTASRIRSWLDQQCLLRERLLPAVCALWFFLTLLFALILLGQPAVMNGFFGRYWPVGRVEFLLVVYQRIQTLLLWITAFLGQALLFLYIVYRQAFHSGSAYTHTSLVTSSWTIWVLYAVLALVMRYIILGYFLPVYEFTLDLNYAILIFIGLRTLLLQYFGDRTWFPAVSNYLIAALVFCVTFILYRFGTIYVDLINTPAKAYFNNLADSLIQGRLYLNNPGQTHDLTMYKGNWYVANPPLVAILMVPWVYLGGFDSLNTVVFSIIFSGLNGSLLFLLLQTIAKRGWTRLHTSGSLWLTAFLIFGSVHFYLGQIGKMWFLSQITTITFVLLAIQIAVLKKPAWVSGAAIALAMMARPNIPVILPILLGIDFQNAREANEKYTFERLLRWGIPTLIPIFVAGLVLLGYNWLRFDNILDYGYLTENVADFMAADLKNYGTFSTHFILRNMKVMFLALPKWSAYCHGYLPSVSGLSMLIVSPAIVYLLGSFRRKAWVIGAWSSIVSVMIPLALYYNTGAWQFGYKYFLDFSIPVVMLLAVAAGEKVPWLLRILIICGIVVNIYGMLWFSGAVCRG